MFSELGRLVEFPNEQGRDKCEKKTLQKVKDMKIFLALTLSLSPGTSCLRGFSMLQLRVGNIIW